MAVTQVQIPLGSNAPSLYNPMRSGTWQTEDGTLEVLFYYVRLVRDDGVVTDDELEPVVLRDGYLVGVGWAVTAWGSSACHTRRPMATPAQPARETEDVQDAVPDESAEAMDTGQAIDDPPVDVVAIDTSDRAAFSPPGGLLPFHFSEVGQSQSLLG